MSFPGGTLHDNEYELEYATGICINYQLNTKLNRRDKCCQIKTNLWSVLPIPEGQEWTILMKSKGWKPIPACYEMCFGCGSRDVREDQVFAFKHIQDQGWIYYVNWFKDVSDIAYDTEHPAPYFYFHPNDPEVHYMTACKRCQNKITLRLQQHNAVLRHFSWLPIPQLDEIILEYLFKA